MATSCSDDVEVQIEESATEVAVRIVGGEAIDGDCGGSVVATLEAPLGDRSIVVDGDQWIIRSDCDVAVAVAEDESTSCPVLDE